MSLQVWLPLNGDLTQQGLSGVEATNNGATINNEGKIGKCYQFGTASSGINIPSSVVQNFTECSVAFWVKIISWNASYATLFQIGVNGRSWQNYHFGILRNSTSSNLCFVISNGTSSSTTSCLSSALQLNQWYHLTFTYNKDGYYRIYINGVLDKESYTETLIPNFASATKITIGQANDGQYQSNCLINDVRIYDHCLSVKEIKELSKSLVLHYRLNNGGGGPSNLLKNGFGELGTENWDNPSNVTTTDLPTADSNIKAKFISTTSKEFIPVYRNHNYKISAYIKGSTTSGNSYPSIRVYDIDKNEIWNYQTTIGFNLNTMTTLTQELKSGDTKIYVDNLSAWNANSGHNYNHAAIFGYADSTGYIYPDGVYTRITPNFGTGTNAKTNLDKTNNIITLNTAYSGRTIPAGTSVCASTDGATYFYPFGEINIASTQNWTYKEGTFSAEHGRFVAAAYMKVMAYSGTYLAGIKLIDTSIEDTLDKTKEFDCSGYQYDGNIIGTLINYPNTSKYDVSTYFYSSDPTTNSSTGLSYIEANFGLTAPIQMSVCWWAKPENGYGGSTSHAAWCTSSSSAPTDYNSTAFHHRDGCFDICLNSASTTSIHLNMNYTKNEWHYYCVTYDGKIAKLYKDGVFSNQVTVSSTDAPLKTFSKLFIGYSKAGGVWRKTLGSYSDFRIYATALSAEDVAELYHTAASVDNHGNIYAGEIKEV